MKSAVRWLAIAAVAGVGTATGAAADAPPPAGGAPARVATVSFPGYVVSQRRYRPVVMHDSQAMIRLPEVEGPDEDGSRTVLGLSRGRMDSPISSDSGSGYALTPPRAAEKTDRRGVADLAGLLSDKGEAEATPGGVSEGEIESALGGVRRGATPQPTWAPVAPRTTREGQRPDRNDADDSSGEALFGGIPSDRGGAARALLLSGGRDARGDASELGRDLGRALDYRSNRGMGWADARREERDSGRFAAGGAFHAGDDGANPYASLLTPRGGTAAAEARPSLYAPAEELRHSDDAGLFPSRPVENGARGFGQTGGRESPLPPWEKSGHSVDTSAEPASPAGEAKSLREMYREK